MNQTNQEVNNYNKRETENSPFAYMFIGVRVRYLRLLLT